MKDNNIQNLINLYKSGKFSIAEKKVIKLIKNDPKNFFLLNSTVHITQSNNITFL